MPIIKYTFLLLCFTCFYGWSQEPLSKNEEVAFLEQVKKHSEATTSLKGNFTQTKALSFLENPMKSSGNFYYKSPNSVKWEYNKPYHYSIIFKNNMLHINDDGKKQEVDLNANKLFEKLNNLIVNSMNGKMLLDNDFTVSYIKQNGVVVAKLIPKEKQLATFFNAVELHFNTTNYVVKKVKLIEKSNDFTLIEFYNLQLNPTLNASVFTH